MVSEYQFRYQLGQKIGTRYRVHQIFRGSMSEVYFCLDEQDMIPCVLKTFQQHTPNLQTSLETGVSDWLTLGKHPNLVHCFNTGTFDDIPFVILEWIPSTKSRGMTLQNWLGRSTLDLKVALQFTIHIVRGLQYANETRPGIVHCNLTPSNVLISQHGRAKITNFGFASVAQQLGLTPNLHSLHDSLSLQLSLLSDTSPSSLFYLAPEQWQGKALDIRTDIYAIGCILFELLTGYKVYSGSTLNQLERQHLEAPIPQLNNFPKGLTTIINRCLAKQQNNRFGKINWLLADLYQVYETQIGEAFCETSQQELMAEDYSNRGSAYDILGEYDRALADFDRVISLRPNDIITYSHRGITHAKLGEYVRAIDDFDRVIVSNPSDASAYSNRATSYAGLGQYKQAIADFDQTIVFNPNDATIYSNRGTSYAGLGQHEQAIADFDRAIELNPDLAQSYYNRGTSYAAIGRYDQALLNYTRAIELHFQDAQAFLNRGNCRVALKQYEQALSDYSHAIILDPNDARGYSNRGNCHFALGHLAQALVSYDHALELDPNNGSTWLNKGILMVNLERLHESLFCFEKAEALGNSQAVGYAKKVQQALKDDLTADDTTTAYKAFQNAKSFKAMRQAVHRFPILIHMLPSLQALMRQIPLEHRRLYKKQLTWLGQIAQGK